MRNLILSLLCITMSCSSSQTDSVNPCIVGTFGSNTPVSAYSADIVKGSNITDLEKKIVFRGDGTGYYYIPVIKNQFPEYRVDFAYTYKNNNLEITAKKIFSNGIEMPSDGLGNDDILLEGRLKFFKLFPLRVQQISCECSKSGLKTIFKDNNYDEGNFNSLDRVLDHNKITDVSSWIRR